jgi:NADH-quinone oxidoreductase subunit J
LNGPYGIYTLATLLGTVGLWLLLPRGRVGGRTTGAALGAISLGLFASRLPGLGAWTANGVFAVLAGVTVVAAVNAVSFRNPVYCAVWFGLSLLGTAGLFLLNGAQFLAVATIVVYAGAILVTFLFVLMLAQPEGRAPYDRVSWESLVGAATGVVLIGILTMTLASVLTDPREPISPPASEEQMAVGVLGAEHVARLGGELFGRHLIAVEVAGVLLLAALVGAAVIVAQMRGDNGHHG